MSKSGLHDIDNRRIRAQKPAYHEILEDRKSVPASLQSLKDKRKRVAPRKRETIEPCDSACPYDDGYCFVHDRHNGAQLLAEMMGLPDNEKK